LSAVRNVERCARFLTVAARDFRMFFFADAILGTATLCSRNVDRDAVDGERGNVDDSC
jgi:hypothetical protein